MTCSSGSTAVARYYMSSAAAATDCRAGVARVGAEHGFEQDGAILSNVRENERTMYMHKTDMQAANGWARRWPYFQNRCGEAPEVSGKVAPCWCHYVHRELQDSAARATLHVLRQLIHMPCIVKLLFA